MVLERSRYSIFVACSRTTKCTRKLFLNNRTGHKYPHFETSLDGCTISTAFKTWMLWTSSTVQEPLLLSVLYNAHVRKVKKVCVDSLPTKKSKSYWKSTQKENTHVAKRTRTTQGHANTMHMKESVQDVKSRNFFLVIVSGTSTSTFKP